ncbi:MAG TPA: ATP-binding protein [Gemmatimonadales bacterium]|nr:ATP-binding protein [Gemmatimonadales bacterium]
MKRTDLGANTRDAAALLRRAAAFGQELAGTLRRASVLDLLVRHVQDILHPVECAVAHVTSDAEAPPLLHSWPAGLPDRTPAVELAMRSGPRLVRDDIGAELQKAGLEPFASTVGSWLLAPLTTRGRATGAVVIRGTPGQFGPTDLAIAEALAAQASVALESARLVDVHDEGRRSWQDVVDAIAPALCIVDPSGSIRRANRAFATLVTSPLAALIGRPWRAFLPPEWLRAIERLLEVPGREREVELRTGDRSYVVSAVPLTGEHPATVLLFDDQTERHRLQDQLLQSEKMSAIGQLIAGIAHDLNNPLASVVGFADFLSELPDVPPNLREPLSVIHEEASRASNIVKNLLSFARKQDRARRPTDIKPLLESTFVLLRNELMASRVDARIEVEPDLPMPHIDPNQIQQVFVNLITNAAQAIASTGRPGEIVVHARRWHDGIAVDVRDTGPGMAEHLAAKVFDPFFTTKPEGQGTGLGLSISQGIVKEHGGRITLTSEEGRGSTFTVQLPAAAAAPPPAPEGELEHPSARLRVLVVDDEPHILHYMRATLEAWGHEVSLAADGEEALERAAREPFDLVITDLRMPKLGGREFYLALTELNPQRAERLVFSTGDTVRGDTLAFLESLGRPYLHKPFSLAELRTLLAGLTRHD